MSAWGSNTKIRMRGHLSLKHNMSHVAGLLPPTAGDVAAGDMGIQ